MSVKKTTRECYEIRNGAKGTWANISLDCWERINVPYTNGVIQGGELMIHSDWGNFAYTWRHTGPPFKKFLIGLSFDYLFTKLMGNDLDVFDGEASLKAVLQKICEARREERIHKSDARELWDEVQLYVDYQDEHAFGEGMRVMARELVDRHPMHDYFADPMNWPRRTRYDHQAVGFWRDIWPLFTEALKAELAEPQPQPA